MCTNASLTLPPSIPQGAEAALAAAAPAGSLAPLLSPLRSHPLNIPSELHSHPILLTIGAKLAGAAALPSPAVAAAAGFAAGQGESDTEMCESP